MYSYFVSMTKDIYNYFRHLDDIITVNYVSKHIHCFANSV